MIIYAIVSAWLILFAIITLGSKIDPTTGTSWGGVIKTTFLFWGTFILIVGIGIVGMLLFGGS
uniref:Uncharacterized protein n=1 Tax=viral metagenome TaxID=1070528 RepID=A0A6M3IDX9_9ZZZZ